VDDGAYARQVARSRVLGRGDSRRRLQQELSRKGVARDVADEAVAEVFDEEAVDEEALVEAAARKKLRALGALDAATRRRRLWAFLARRGHDGDAIRRVLGRVLAPGEETCSTSWPRTTSCSTGRRGRGRALKPTAAYACTLPTPTFGLRVPPPPGILRGLCAPPTSAAGSSPTSSGRAPRAPLEHARARATTPPCCSPTRGWSRSRRCSSGWRSRPEGRRRATTAQKCVRAGGKHNDLEQVGHTARHHTFFEMLGNFSFGDYFKRDAIRFAWQFVTEELAIPREHLRVSVFHEDDEARALWREIAGLPDSRIYGLGREGQLLADGRHRPVRPVHGDLRRPREARVDWRFPRARRASGRTSVAPEFSTDAFVEGAEAGRFLEIWNLVFMQFDRQADGTLVPLPKPSVDTGAGLERDRAVMQGVTNNFHTDLFAPLLATVEAVVGAPYRGRETDAVVDGNDPASYRVLADHARAVAFLLADGVFPSNEGRGYVLRRILRRAVRHAYLLGRTGEPTLYRLVQVVVDTMGDVYPELRQRAQHLVATTRAEEERFLATIEGGSRASTSSRPARSTQGSARCAASLGRGRLPPVRHVRLPDRPHGADGARARLPVDISGFERALERQRAQSQEERRSATSASPPTRSATSSVGARAEPAELGGAFVGYDTVAVDSEVAAVRRLDGDRVAVLLRETPFYAESGGQVSTRRDRRAGWRVDVDEVRKVEGRVAAVGALTGTLSFGPATARVPGDRRRDTERNHTATHLLHAALRQVLGEHVHQAGSVVEPDRLRFDFTHHGPVRPEQLEAVEVIVNRGIWSGVPLRIEERHTPRRSPAVRWRSSARSTATSCAWWTFRGSRRSCAGAPTCATRRRSGCSASCRRRASRPACDASSRSPARRRTSSCATASARCSAWRRRSRRRWSRWSAGSPRSSTSGGSSSAVWKRRSVGAAPARCSSWPRAPWSWAGRASSPAR
jgi:alanyl-tRNA synthetase